MPILEIEIFLRPGEMLASDLAKRLADACADIFKSDPRQTWIILRTLDPGQYAENEADGAEPVFPVFVQVLKSSLIRLLLRWRLYGWRKRSGNSAIVPGKMYTSFTSLGLAGVWLLGGN